MSVEMLGDLPKSLKATMYDRVTSPLSGAFIFSWCLWNWEILFFMFFGKDEPASSRIEHIVNLPYLCSYYGCGWYGLNGGVMHILVLPLLSALFFIFLYPIPSRWVYSYSKKEQEKLIKIKIDIEKITPVSQEKYDKLILQINEQEHNMASQIEGYKTTLTALERENKELKEKVFPLNQLENRVKIIEEAPKGGVWQGDPDEKGRGGDLVQDNSLHINTPSVIAESIDEPAWEKEYAALGSGGKLDDFNNFLADFYGNIQIANHQLAKYDGLGLINVSSGSPPLMTAKGKFFNALFQKDPNARNQIL